MDTSDGLKNFHQRVQELYRRATPYGDGRRANQRDLAVAIGLHPVELSNRLNGSKAAKLTVRDIKAIVRTLAEWGAITTHAEAVELLDVVNCPTFSRAEWAAPPLDMLEQGIAPAAPAPPSSTPSNLPAALTSFIGRKQEVMAISQLLRQDDVRLLTLTGTGGSGKSRLSLQIGQQLLPNFRDGVYLVELAPLSDPALVPASIAQALGVAEQGQPTVARLREHLRDRTTLLILDNFEHLLPAASLINELLKAAAKLKIIVTSRALLHLYGEREYIVPPLSLPRLDPLPPLAELKQYAAMSLFVDRAIAARYDFTLSEQNAGAVAGICTRLDGLPLAIELAAARIKHLFPAHILEQLQGHLRHLQAETRDLPARQRSLWGAIDWSYDLLTEAEQQVFTHFAVFAGGADVAAAAAVCAIPTPAIQDLLTSLTDKSLLYPMPADEPRFGMLETIREYALERLAESGDEQATMQRHAAHYAALAERTESLLRGHEQTVWLARLDAEQDNLRAALGWLVQGEHKEAIRLAAALGWFWLYSTRIAEGRQWLTAVLALSQHDAALTAKTLDRLGRFDRINGDYPAAELHLGQALAIYQDSTDAEGIASTLMALGNLACSRSDYPAARNFYEQALATQQELGLLRSMAGALHNLGNVAYEQGDYTAAGNYFERSLAIMREFGDEVGLANALIGRAEIYEQIGDYAAALHDLDESLALQRKIGSREGIARTLSMTGNLLVTMQNYAAAQHTYQESLAIFRELGHQERITNLLIYYARACYRQGDYDGAAVMLHESIALFHDFNNKHGLAEELESWAGLLARQRPAAAATLLGTANALRLSVGAPLPPSLRHEYEQDVAEIRTQLDAAAFAEAWGAGAAMRMEAAIRLADVDYTSSSNR